jgi:hypothetical protein
VSDYAPPADKVRAALKAAGYGARQVTVRDGGNYMYSSLKVTIRDACVRISAVEAIARRHEDVRRCETSGEILSGGNTFVEVAYLDAITEPLVSAIEARLLATSNGEIVEVAGARMSIDFDRSRPAAQHHAEVTRWDDEHGSRFCSGVRHAARQLAVAWLDRGGSLADITAPADAWLDRLDLDDEPTVSVAVRTAGTGEVRRVTLPAADVPHRLRVVH